MQPFTVVQSGRAAEGEAPIFSRIGIVGLGLIGGSVALAARQAWPKALVIGVDNSGVLEMAMRLGAVDVGADDLVVIAEADLIILAAPVRQNIAILAELDANIRQSAVVTDTGSTKRDIMTAARGLPPRLRFIGGHPLAGAAEGGLEHARADLFSGRPWLLTAEGDGSGDDVARLSAFVSAFGAEARSMSLTAHDRVLAFMSHLPQLTASALMCVVGDAVGQEGLALAGRGLADTTRLATSPAGIWKDIAATNAGEIGAALDELIALLQELRRDLPTGDRLGDVFNDARRWRASLRKT